MSDVPSQPTIVLPIDRIAATVRAFWRLLCGGVIVGLLGVAAWQVSWQVLWWERRLTCLALGLVFGAIGLVGVGLIAAAGRWLLLALWFKARGVTISPDGVRIDAGPFGRQMYDWQRMRMTMEAGVEPEFIDRMPDDALSISLRHPLRLDDLGPEIQRLCGLDAAGLTRTLRPYFARIEPGS